MHSDGFWPRVFKTHLGHPLRLLSRSFGQGGVYQQSYQLGQIISANKQFYIACSSGRTWEVCRGTKAASTSAELTAFQLSKLNVGVRSSQELACEVFYSVLGWL